MCVCNTNLPGAETLEEEIECKAPDDSREQNTHQCQTLDSLTTPQLKAQLQINIHASMDTQHTREHTHTFIMM